MNYNSGEWFGWNGGECPVHPETVVEYSMKNCTDNSKAMELRWGHIGSSGDIIAFRVIKEHKEPREFWIETIHGELPTVWLHKPDLSDHPHYNGACIHVREVLPE